LRSEAKTSKQNTGTVKDVPLKQIRPNRLNPRLDISVSRLNGLADSIKQVGLLEPIILRPMGENYEVVVGERRYRASQQAGLSSVPAIVRDYTDDEVVQLNLIENVQREELSAVEKGKVCQYLLANCRDKYPTQSVIAKKIGVSPETISAWLRTTELIPQEVQNYVAPSAVSGDVPDGKIDYQTAVRVGRIVEEPERRVEIIKKLAEKHLPVKERAEVIRRAASEPEKSIEEVFAETFEVPIELEFPASDKKSLLDGTKTQLSSTRMPDPKIKDGTIVHATIHEPHIAELRVRSIERKRLRYFDEEDANREGGYSLEEFKKLWKKSHMEWDENQLAYVIHFEKTR
jgi:ParB family chromosome partitioning protein